MVSTDPVRHRISGLRCRKVSRTNEQERGAAEFLVVPGSRIRNLPDEACTPAVLCSLVLQDVCIVDGGNFVAKHLTLFESITGAVVRFSCEGGICSHWLLVWVQVNLRSWTPPRRPCFLKMRRMACCCVGREFHNIILPGMSSAVI
jgi:hypothetical protein